MLSSTRCKWFVCCIALVAVAGLPALGQQAPPPEDNEEPADTVEDVIIVTASRTEQSIHDAPATVTVMTSQTIAETPADDYGDLLRNIPGLNVSQTSAREINITARGSTNTLATSQLVMLDGRSIYLDFFGFVMWDFLPVNTAEIKQIEVVQGPASAVWGANAMTGVVNLITKRPKEMVGTNVVLGAGELSTMYGSVTHAGVADKLGYKLSAGYYEQDAYPRPTSFPLPTGGRGNLFPFDNEGTQQPKVDLRLDWDLAEGSTFGVSGGYAGTSGIVHTGIGPFRVENGSNLAYTKVDWNRRALHVDFFGNFLDADSENFLATDLTGRRLPFAFASKTYNLDVANTSVIGNSAILTYGGNARSNTFDLEIAPRGDRRDELGAFAQGEFMFGQHVRWMAGARYDDVEVVDPVISPRTSLMLSPNQHHTFRLSYNRAFRAPSVVNNFIDTRIRVPIAPFPITISGNENLNEERMKALEAGYVGTFENGMTMSLAVYRNKTIDSIDFFLKDTYSATNLPPGIPAVFAPCFLFFPGTIVPGTPGVTPALIGLCTNPALGGLAAFRGFRELLPSEFSYRNIGETTDEGVEFSLQQRVNDTWSWFANYSYQKESDIRGAPLEDVNQSPKARYNVGLAYDAGRFFANTNVNHADEAYWADVLNIRGTTDAYTQLNAAFGLRFAGDRVTLTVTGSNLTDEDVQQHIFGDILTRKFSGQVSFRF